MLLDELLAIDVLKIQIILRVINSLCILLKWVIFVACNKNFGNLLLAKSALIILHLQALSQDTGPTAEVVTTFTDCVINYVFYTNRALLKLFLFDKNFGVKDSLIDLVIVFVLSSSLWALKRITLAMTTTEHLFAPWLDLLIWLRILWFSRRRKGSSIAMSSS